MIAARKLAQRTRRAGFETRAAEALQGRFTFLGRTVDLGHEPDWRSARLCDVPRLWRFQLEYHEWLLDLAACADMNPGDVPSESVWHCVQRWIETWTGATERSAGDAWHPYCISRRLPVWLSLWAWNAPPAAMQPLVARSVLAQAAFLSRRLETDLGGNHLLENLRALALAGVACDDGAGHPWLEQVSRLLPRECREQVLPHGEHFERSPMYHWQMIDVLWDIRDVTVRRSPPLSTLCGELVERMERCATDLLHPDGGIPLLGDSVFGDVATPVQTRLRSSITMNRVAADFSARRIGDYWSFQDGADFLLFDAGPVGPDHLPAHAHADLLTLEASAGGCRLFVDSGTFDYEDSVMRQYCRSTAAHNTLEIDGENQCDVWSRFRMGRRGWPGRLQVGETDGFAWARATHNAYRHLRVPTVGRWIACRPALPWLIVDWAVGTGTHQLTNRLHLHPDVRVRSQSSLCVHLELDTTSYFLTGLGPGRLTIAEGWYCPAFGCRIRNAVLQWDVTCPLPAAVGWCLSREPISTAPTLDVTSETVEVRLPRDGSEQRFRVPVSPTCD